MLKKLINGIKYWGQVFLLPVYGFSFITPRNKKIWVFGSTFGRRFADNPKYFYLYMNQYHPVDIKPIWISKNKKVIELLQENKLEAYYLYSAKGIYYCLRSKVFIYDNYTKDISFTLSGGAIKINMWHGIPLKKINRDNKFDTIRNSQSIKDRLRWALRRMTNEKPSHYVLTTSEYLRPVFSSAFGTNKVLTYGYPRNDFLVSEKIKNVFSQEEKLLNSKIEEFKGKKVLYMPTFRDKEIVYWENINLHEFQSFLHNNNMLFCIKLHPKSKLIKYFLNIDKKYNNIVIIDSEWDPYQLLKMSDILVTDYSSTYFDFLCRNKPIIFFDYDKNEYLVNCRELYFDYEEFTPGIKVKTIKELEFALLQEDNYGEERQRILYKVFDDTLFAASERIYRKISAEIL